MFILVHTIQILIIAALINTAFVTDPFELRPVSSDSFTSMDLSEETMSAAALRLSAAIAARTISYSATNLSLDATSDLLQLMEDSFPMTHAAEWINVWPINTHSRREKYPTSVSSDTDFLMERFLTGCIASRAPSPRPTPTSCAVTWTWYQRETLRSGATIPSTPD